MRALGIDVGSLNVKAVILDGNAPLASALLPAGEGAETSAKAAMEEVISRSGLSGDDWYVVSTGIGGKSVAFSQQQKAMTTCLARGVHILFPTARMIIDLGAETSTVLKINERGRVTDWAGQDKCAAGTGMFLQAMSKVMQVKLEEMDDYSLRAGKKADITGTCAVFAESEVISHIHRVPPTPKEEIIAGIHASMVSRVMGLLKRLGIEKDVALVGGVARNRGLVDILEKELGFKVFVPDAPETVGALGAAVLAKENIEKGAG
ncbi:MAG: 2-hydroxyglutaryl-CoA dehydratase [Dehalococcoidales bacterium]|nr:2-hydroxyglutaryl-CoA dehydratase [Dehalococcoidales bacterium]